MTSRDPTSAPATTPRWQQFVAAIAIGLVAGGLVVAATISPTKSTPPAAQPLATAAPAGPSASKATTPVAGKPGRYADFGTEAASADARHIADWVADSKDNGKTAFIIIDKKLARAYVFDADAHLRASAPILLGAANGDESVPGIGARPLSLVKPEEKTTPAGRFLAQRGKNLTGEDVVWVDYDAAVSMHRVRTSIARERRLERLTSPTIEDNRISSGCINMPKAFYESFVKPMFAAQRAVVYVLPEVKPVREVFGSYEVAARHGEATR